MVARAGAAHEHDDHHAGDRSRSTSSRRTEYEKIVALLGREPTYTELGIFSVMWSEHCSYKSSRLHLKKLPTRGKLVVQGPGENAGIIDIGDGYVDRVQDRIAQPSQLHRAVSGRGHRRRRHSARHLHHGRAAHRGAGFAALRPPRRSATGARNRRILEGVVAGIAHYGNCFGVPTVGGECVFEACYNGNPLVNVFALGVCQQGRDLLRARPPASAIR